MTTKDLRATWTQAFVLFLSPILFVMCVRWLLIEPYVIPSGSMIPTLLINDNVFVNKLKYGVKVPFGNQFIFRWANLQRGDVVVFRQPQNPDVFFIKRVVAIGGDTVSVEQGVLKVNDQAYKQESIEIPRAEEGFEYFKESMTPDRSYTIRYQSKEFSDFPATTIPENSFFVIGDNRDQSNDSRAWGVVPEENLVGKALIIWLSCDQTLSSARFLCNPQTMRAERIFKSIH